MLSLRVLFQYVSFPIKRLVLIPALHAGYYLFAKKSRG